MKNIMMCTNKIICYGYFFLKASSLSSQFSVMNESIRIQCENKTKLGDNSDKALSIIIKFSVQVLRLLNLGKP